MSSFTTIEGEETNGAAGNSVIGILLSITVPLFEYTFRL